MLKLNSKVIVKFKCKTIGKARDKKKAMEGIDARAERLVVRVVR